MNSGKILNLTLALSLLSAIVALSPSSPARNATGVLEGTVLDSGGNPLSGATVTIQTSDGNHPHVTRTDAQGHFAFVRFRSGQYDLRAYHAGAYSIWNKRIMVHATMHGTKPVSVTLRLLPPKR